MLYVPASLFLDRETSDFAQAVNNLCVALLSQGKLKEVRSCWYMTFRTVDVSSRELK